MPKKSYRRKSSNMVKQTPEQKILEHLLLIKDQVIEREVLPFDVGRFAYMPFNAFTKHSYRGMYNLLMLMMQCFTHGWEDPRFVTVGKAKEIKADFRKQPTTMLWAPVIIKGRNEETGEEEVKAIRFRAFRVFNVEQFANRDELCIPPLPRSRWGDTPIMERIEAVREHALANFKVEPAFIEKAMISSPHYRPDSHEIVLPPPAEYHKPERFVQSLLHELMHATGAPSELNRFKKHKADFHGKRAQEYGYEEMVAQFATAFLITEYGFKHESKSSAAYILSWYKAIEDKPELLGQSIREAMSVIRHVLKDNPLPDYSQDEEMAEPEMAVAA